MKALLRELERRDFAPRFGHVRSIAAGLVEASGPDGMLGELCSIEEDGGKAALGEVVAIDEKRVLLSLLDPLRPVKLGARVVALGRGGSVGVGDGFSGRAVNALGDPIDGRGEIPIAERAPLHGEVPDPLRRTSHLKAMPTGIRAIDGLLTLGVGQRVGIVAASGVGKTSLVEQIATQAEADHVILCLVGERGREVQAFWEMLSSRKDADRFTLVAATSDESAAHRARSPALALALGEYWRSQGRHVLLLVDSVTRLAMALREIGLAAGSPPTVRAYTPNVFSVLPRLVERCGGIEDGGAISAIMTVLSETDDADDPIVELMKSLLDGHIVLSRVIAEQGQFPAIDIVRSVSRGIEQRVAPAHRKAQREIAAMLGAYEESRVLIETGAYRAGTNPLLDQAIARRDAIQGFLAQPKDQNAAFDQTVAALASLVANAR